MQHISNKLAKLITNKNTALEILDNYFKDIYLKAPVMEKITIRALQRYLNDNLS